MSGNEYFRSDLFTSTSTACSTLTYSVWATASGTIASTYFEFYQSVDVDTEIRVPLKYGYTDDVGNARSFFIKAELNGGASSIFGPYSLELTCGPLSVPVLT